MVERAARSGWALWVGPVLALLGVWSYFAIFAFWPATRDFPWVNLLILALALGLSILGARRSWGQTLARRLLGLVSVGVSGLLAAVLVLYCFKLSYDLPPEDPALAIGQPIPALTLLDQQGDAFELAPAAAERLVLVFYRGHW
jgi:hypothetical protein